MPYDPLPDVQQVLRERRANPGQTYMGVDLNRFEKEDLVLIATHFSELLSESYSDRKKDLQLTRRLCRA